MKLKQVLLMLLLSMFISRGAFASSQDIVITIDGSELYTDVAPQVINNRTLVPIRAIFEAIGGEVEWDNDTQTAIGRKGNDTIILQVGNKKASINGKEIILDVPATAVNGRTLVPVRFVAESLGSGIFWDNDSRTVVIQTSATPEVNFRFNREKGEITDYRYDGPKDVVIPKTIDGVVVRRIGNYAFKSRNLRSVVISEGVTELGRSSFESNKLVSAIIPEGITVIYDSSFKSNNLVSVIIPESLEYIGNNAFESNQLTSVTIPERVTEIGMEAFINNNLTSVTFPKGIKHIRKYAFINNNLSQVTISAWIKTMGKNTALDTFPDGSAFDDNTLIIFKGY